MDSVGNTKVCYICLEEKSVSAFFRNARSAYGCTSRCKKCDSEYQKKYRATKSRKVPEGVTHKICRSCHKELSVSDFSLHKDCKWGLNPWCKKCAVDRVQKANQVRHRAYLTYQANYRKTHLKERQRYLKKYGTDHPEFALACRIRSGLRKGIAKADGRKGLRTSVYLGVTFSECLDYLKVLFWPGMNVNNMGRGGWDIDHIIPLSLFDLGDFEQQKLAFHYTNLQPLWHYDNTIAKSDRLDWSPFESAYELPDRIKREVKTYWKVVFNVYG